MRVLMQREDPPIEMVLWLLEQVEDELLDDPAGFWYMQLPIELLAPLSDRHVSQSPEPSQPPSEMARHEASLSHALRAAD